MYPYCGGLSLHKHTGNTMSQTHIDTERAGAQQKETRIETSGDPHQEVYVRGWVANLDMNFGSARK